LPAITRWLSASIVAGASCGPFIEEAITGSARVVRARDGMLGAVAGFGTETVACEGGAAEGTMATSRATGGRRGTRGMVVGVAEATGGRGGGDETTLSGVGGRCPNGCGEENRLGEPSQPGRRCAPSSLSSNAATSGSMFCCACSTVDPGSPLPIKTKNGHLMMRFKFLCAVPITQQSDKQKR